MGNDGGSIPTRRELVKEAAREKTTSEVWDASQQNSAYHWTYCPLSKRPLALPIVSDSIGRLFNKDSILEWLLQPAFGDGAEVLKVGGVAGLKDVVDVKFEVANDAGAEKNGNGGAASANGIGKVSDARMESWVCPVSRKELGPGSRAVYLVPCGHAFAQTVISEIKTQECLVCSEPFETSNVITINPSQKSDIDKLKARMEKLSADGLSHSLKKVSKKRKKDKEKRAGENGTKESNGATKATEAKDKSASIANAATANITSKVLAEQESSKRRKVESDSVKSLYTSSADSKNGGATMQSSANRDFMSRGYTIPSNAKR